MFFDLKDGVIAEIHGAVTGIDHFYGYLRERQRQEMRHKPKQPRSPAQIAHWQDFKNNFAKGNANVLKYRKNMSAEQQTQDG